MNLNELRSSIEEKGALETTIQLLEKAGLSETAAELLISSLLEETADKPKK